MKIKQIEDLTKNLPIALFVFIYYKNGQKGFRYVSQSVNNILGKKIFESDNYLDYFETASHKMIEKEHIRCYTSKKPFNLELKIRNTKGIDKWIHMYASFSDHDENGNILYTGYISDITKIKKENQIIKDRDKLFRKIFDKIPLSIFAMDQNKNMIYHNIFFKSLIKLRNKSILLNSRYNLNNTNELFFSGEEIKDVLIHKKSKTSEEVLVDQNGSLIYYQNWITPLVNRTKETIHIIGYSLNITSSKIIQNKLVSNEIRHREIIDKMNLGLIEINFNGDIIFANSTFLRMSNLKYNEIDQFDINNIIDNIEQEEIDLSNKKNWNTQKAKEISFKLNGHTVWWLLNTTIQFDEDGNVSLYIIVCLDISQQKKLEEELNFARISAENNSNVKDIFMAKLSHEIRTPLNALIGLSTLLNKMNLDEKQEKYIKLLKTSADHLLSIVNDVLDLAKINAGKIQIEETPFHINEVIRNNIKIFTIKADEKGIYLNLDIEDYNEDQLYIGDPHKFSQILSNLISNAIKFTEKGGVSVTSKIIKEDEVQSLFQITVSDTGIGIDKNFIDKIYEIFTQENESTTRIYGGTGLGMSITKELLTILHGKIHVQSEKNIGSEFVIEIPFNKVNKDKVLLHYDSKEIPISLKGRRILIVDDNDMNRLVGSIMLSEHGAEIVEAENGFDSIKVIKKEKIDLVLMDIQMPVMNGYETTRKIRKMGFKHPIIALTAYAVKDERDRCMESGMNDFITKPFEERHLISTVYKAISQEPEFSTQNVEKAVGIQNDDELNLSELRSLCNNDMKQFSRMIKLFVNQSKIQIEDLNAAYNQGDAQKIRAIAHQMKPSIQWMGINSIEKDIKWLEDKYSNIGKNTLTYNAIQKVQEIMSKIWSTIHAMNIE